MGLRPLVLGVLLLSLVGTRALEHLTKPNFILLLADDMGYGDAGFTGHPTIMTPNLDSLAAGGMKLNQLYEDCALHLRDLTFSVGTLPSLVTSQ